MMCPGPWDPKTGEQIGPDTCIPHKIGECNAHCPMTCKDSDMMCPGMTHSDGCKDADYCISGSKQQLQLRKRSFFSFHCLIICSVFQQSFVQSTVIQKKNNIVQEIGILKQVNK